jgi:hypothetical protein
MLEIGRVVIRPVTQTTISAPNFTPKLNVAITDIQNVNVTVRQEGDTLIYDAATGEYKSQPIQQAAVDIKNINGGRF